MLFQSFRIEILPYQSHSLYLFRFEIASHRKVILYWRFFGMDVPYISKLIKIRQQQAQADSFSRFSVIVITLFEKTIINRTLNLFTVFKFLFLLIAYHIHKVPLASFVWLVLGI